MYQETKSVSVTTIDDELKSWLTNEWVSPLTGVNDFSLFEQCLFYLDFLGEVKITSKGEYKEEGSKGKTIEMCVIGPNNNVTFCKMDVIVINPFLADTVYAIKMTDLHDNSHKEKYFRSHTFYDKVYVDAFDLK